MNITPNISEKMIQEALNLTGIKDKNKLVEQALKSLINQSKRQKLIALNGKLNLDIDLDALRNRS